MLKLIINGKQSFNSINGGIHFTGSSYRLWFGQLFNAIRKKKSFSVKSNIIAHIHTNRIHKYLSVRTKRSQFPRFSLLVPNSQERSSPRKLRPMEVKSWLGSPPSHLAEEISAGLRDRETHIHRNSDIYVQFKEVHWKQSQTHRRCRINAPF